MGRDNFDDKGMPRHARQHSDVNCAKMAEPIEMPFGLWEGTLAPTGEYECTVGLWGDAALCQIIWPLVIIITRAPMKLKFGVKETIPYLCSSAPNFSFVGATAMYRTCGSKKRKLAL